MEWDWYTQGEDAFYCHWSPNNDLVIDLELKGYNEVLITYIMAEAYLAIDQGPQLIMIENYRSGSPWNLFMQNEDVRAGLNKLSFSYGN